MPPKCIPGAPANVTVKISDLNLTGSFKIRDVWAKKDLGPATVSRNERQRFKLPALVAARESTQRLHVADSVGDVSGRQLRRECAAPRLGLPDPAAGGGYGVARALQARSLDATEAAARLSARPPSAVRVQTVLAYNVRLDGSCVLGGGWRAGCGRVRRINDLYIQVACCARALISWATINKQIVRRVRATQELKRGRASLLLRARD